MNGHKVKGDLALDPTDCLQRSLALELGGEGVQTDIQHDLRD